MRCSSRKVGQEIRVPGEGLRHIFKPKIRSNKALKTLLSWFESTKVAAARQALQKPLKDKQAPKNKGWGECNSSKHGFLPCPKESQEEQS